MQIEANGITLDYDETGPRDGVPLVLIRGLGSQRIHWPDAFLTGLAAAGYRVITFDNRDIGRSRRCPAPGVDGRAETILAEVAAGRQPAAAYSLDDMARDVVGLMDALGIDRAHVFGMSMGGGIVQLLALDHAPRLRSATIVMARASFVGGGPLDKLLAHPETREQFIETALWADREWGSPGFPVSEEYLRAQAGAAFDRGAEPEGVNRQLLAILHSGDRRDRLGGVTVPCLVIHGAQDTLIGPEHGREIAALIPDAELEVIEGMGHVITPLLSPVLIARLDRFIRDQGQG